MFGSKKVDATQAKKLKLCFGVSCILLCHMIIDAQLFNATVDGLLAMQAHWRITSQDLRTRVEAQLVQQVLESYQVFYGAYSTEKFSKKHMDQYLRYPPTEVEAVLKKIFK